MGLAQTLPKWWIFRYFRKSQFLSGGQFFLRSNGKGLIFCTTLSSLYRRPKGLFTDVLKNKLKGVLIHDLSRVYSWAAEWYPMLLYKSHRKNGCHLKILWGRVDESPSWPIAKAYRNFAKKFKIECHSRYYLKCRDLLVFREKMICCERHFLI